MLVSNRTAAFGSALRSRDSAANSIAAECLDAEHSSLSCFHCGLPCGEEQLTFDEKSFCCRGCCTVFRILTENGLGEFYRLNEAAGVPVRPSQEGQYTFLDEPAVRDRLVDFSGDRLTRITFRVPAIHCVACVWLLENLFRLNSAIAASEVNFLRKEVTLRFRTDELKLSQAASLLAQLGYEPELKFADLEERMPRKSGARLWLQAGLAGFAFGNIMLFSLASYLGLDSLNGPGFKRLFGWLSVALATPVVLYSASDYWRSALVGLRQKWLTLDVPIAAGIAALFLQSVWEISTRRGDGYLDSLTGLIFFLLCGKVFQRKTYDRLAFDRDYKSFFPLSVSRISGGKEERVSLSELEVGNCLLIRHGELIPGDARLTEGMALIDYSFVTGESDPVRRAPGDQVYAGGRQTAGALEIELTKPVSQSYLTSLWNQEAFRKDKSNALDTVTNRYSVRFTKLVIGIALGAALFWAFRDPARSVKAFTSVLIVACPCALALAAPFTLGTALRVLSRKKIFVKNTETLEAIARVDTVVFDKTGTLTRPQPISITYHGSPLIECELNAVCAVAQQSAHPLAARLCGSIEPTAVVPVENFCEKAGLGIAARVSGSEIVLGSICWLGLLGVGAPAAPVPEGTAVHLAIDGKYRGSFRFENLLRPATAELVKRLSAQFDLALLSGDKDAARAALSEVFPESARLRFQQSPAAKLEFISALQAEGKTVMMVGDGLNDSGALRKSHVGVAVVEDLGLFSPASDVILEAAAVPALDSLIWFCRRAVRIVRVSFVLSSLYNVIGIGIAVQGLLSPIVCAVLMPLSSATVVSFACLATAWAGHRVGGDSSHARFFLAPRIKKRGGDRGEGA